MELADRVRDSITDPLQATGLRVEDISVQVAGRRRVVRVLIDRDLTDVSDEHTPIPPISLDAVADGTRVIDGALEDSDVMGAQPYVLEVSSPGTARALTAYEHFRRNVGRLITVTPAGASEPISGRIVGVGERLVTLAIPATKKRPAQDLEFEIADLAGAKVDVEFSRADSDAGIDEEDD